MTEEPVWLNSVVAAAVPEELPVRASTRRALAQVLADDQSPRGRISGVVMADPALALRVLQHANSVEHRHFRFEIVAMEDAIHMLGTHTLAELDRERVILEWLRGLHHGLGLNRAVYAAFDPHRRILTTEQLVGTDFEPGFNRFSLALDRDGVFARLMAAPGALWLNAANRSGLIDQVPVDVRNLTGVESFMARSVWVGGQPVGLIYADRRSDDCALDARAYQGFQRLSALAESALERLV